MVVKASRIEWWPAPPGPSARPKDMLHSFAANRVRAERDAVGHRGITKISKSTKRITFHRARFVIRDAYQPERAAFVFRSLTPHETKHGVRKKNLGKEKVGDDSDESDDDFDARGSSFDGAGFGAASVRMGGGGLDGSGGARHRSSAAHLLQWDYCGCRLQ